MASGNPFSLKTCSIKSMVTSSKSKQRFVRVAGAWRLRRARPPEHPPVQTGPWHQHREPWRKARPGGREERDSGRQRRHAERPAYQDVGETQRYRGQVAAGDHRPTGPPPGTGLLYNCAYIVS